MAVVFRIYGLGIRIGFRIYGLGIIPFQLSFFLPGPTLTYLEAGVSDPAVE